MSLCKSLERGIFIVSVLPLCFSRYILRAHPKLHFNYTISNDIDIQNYFTLDED